MVEITTWKDFLAACERKGVVYRGQTSHFPRVIPSLFRKPLPPNYDNIGPAAAALYLEAYHAEENHAKIVEADVPLQLSEDELGPWGTPPTPFPGHGLGSIGDFDEYAPMMMNFLGTDAAYRHAVLQHYGAPTPTLDVTFDPLIALWFATHVFRSEGSGLARYYRHTEPGFVYMMAASRDHVVDLRGGRLIPAAGLRGQRQAGGLLMGATALAPDLAAHVVEILSVSSEVFDLSHEVVAHLSQRYLFPPPNEDPFFDALVNARFSTNRAMQDLAQYFVVYI
jgi:hypothetical protein